MEAAAAADVVAAPPPEKREEMNEEDDKVSANELLLIKAQRLMDKITSSPNNPNPSVLHALASILEAQESRYMEHTFDSTVNNVRASHTIGRLGNLIRDNDDFFELISSKFLSEPRYSISVQAAALRILFSCSLTWMHPHVFEENVLENINGWIVSDASRSSGEDHNSKHVHGLQKSSEAEMLRTYSTGVLAICLAGGAQIVEDVLKSGLSAKLIRYLRIRTLGEPNRKDVYFRCDLMLHTSIRRLLSWELSQGIQSIPESSLQYANENALMLAKSLRGAALAVCYASTVLSAFTAGGLVLLGGQLKSERK